MSTLSLLNKRRLKIAALTVVAVIVIALAVKIWVFHGVRYYAGHVLTKQDNLITIQAANGLTNTILIDTSESAPAHLRLSSQNIQLGDRIMIIGSQNDEGAVQARLIRILK